MDREFGKEILKCFWMHCNHAYDAMIRTGNNGITAGYGQLITLSGMGRDGRDMTNDLTYAMLEVIDELSPILEPKPNVRLHRGSPDALLDRVIDMISSSQGAPFLLNFDERSMAGMMLEGHRAGLEHLINGHTVHEYAPVGCLENTMAGNDRSGTVDNNINLLKAVELALTGGKDLIPFVDIMTGKVEKIRRDGPDTGDPARFASWDQFWNAYVEQTGLYHTKSASRCRRRPNRRGRNSSARRTSPAWSRGAPKRGSTSPRAARRSALPPWRRSPSPRPLIRSSRSSTWSSTRRNAPWRNSSGP